MVKPKLPHITTVLSVIATLFLTTGLVLWTAYYAYLRSRRRSA